MAAKKFIVCGVEKMQSSYLAEDVTLLLKDITGLVEPLGTREREKRIQGGTHYSEMLPLEYVPTPEYLQAYQAAAEKYALLTARAVGAVAERIWKAKDGRPVLVSLARAGTSIGVLIRRYLLARYRVQVPHYTISIIRGRGIDHQAMQYILARHEAKALQFVDGWTGKGAICRELSAAIADYPGVGDGLAVLSDPAWVAGLCGTHRDFLIASSCLNSTVSGLISRTFYRKDIIGPEDFHGAAYYGNMRGQDLTYAFIQGVEKEFAAPGDNPFLQENEAKGRPGLQEVLEISQAFGIRDINLIKPGIGEATRVLLRRLPWKMLVHSLTDDEHLGHLYQLAKEKNVEVVVYPLQNYKACGLICNLADT